MYEIWAYDSIMCGYFCIEFINFLLKGKILLEYTNLFLPNEYKKWQDNLQNLSKLKFILIFAINTENLKKHMFSKKY